MASSDPELMLEQTVTTGRASVWRRRVIRLVVGLVGVGVAAAVVVAWQTRQNGATPQYRTQQARRGTLIVTVTATGTLQPTKTVDVSSELSGIVQQVDVTYNEKVKRGQVLARLDTSKLDAQVLQSRASLESARAKLLQVQATVTETRASLARMQRARELSGNRLPSQADLDTAVAALARAEADEASTAAAITQAKATLEVNETDLGKSTIRSPIDGIVLTRSVEPGQTVAASLSAPTLFTLAEDLKQMELHVYVDEADVGRVKEGQSATFKVDAHPTRKFQARITQVRYSSTTTSGVVTYRTVLSLDNEDLSLRPGMTATAVIVVQKVENRVLVPNAALRFVPPAEEEKPSSESGGILRKFLPGPPPMAAKTRSETGEAKEARVWMLRGGQLVGVPVIPGSTDGTLTEITSGEVEPGMALAVDTIGVKP